MALLTAEEKEELKKEGLYVREKCDNCKKPILTPVSYIKGKEVWCPVCAKGQDLTKANITVSVKKEKEMAKAKATKKEGKEETTKIAGHLVKGTAIADLYEFLEDERRHKLGEAKKLLSKHKADPMGRIYQLGRYGKKFNGWGIIVDTEAGTIQMKLGKGAAKTSSNHNKSEKSSKKEKDEEDSGASTKGLKIVASLIRKTLKSGKSWTKAKLVKHLGKEADVEASDVKAALKNEIKAGGITLDGGVLELA